jgi:putative PIN family toxin of toxin-antitoxin system
MRVLYDTNVLVTILSRREAILVLKRQITEGSIALITSGHILSEVEAVLVERIGLTKQKAKVASKLLARQSVVVAPRNIVRVCRDPFDDYILATAVVGKAEYIVTADKDLLVLKEYGGIKVITALRFTELLA